jgi:hypothetical protein
VVLLEILKLRRIREWGIWRQEAERRRARKTA